MRCPPARVKVKSSGQECPLHTIKIKVTGSVRLTHPAAESAAAGVHLFRHGKLDEIQRS